VWWKRRGEVRYGLPVAFALAVLILGMTSRVNIGVRHILPVYLGFSIMAAAGVLQLAEWPRTRKWGGIAALLLLAWMAVSGAMSHPDYLAYFNELAGGEPERIIVDSDLDWGQENVRLARRLRELGATEVSFGVANHLSDYLMTWPGFP